MKDSDIQNIKSILEKEYTECIMEEMEAMSEEVRKNRLKIYEEKKVQFNKKRQQSRTCKVGDIVGIKVTQFSNITELNEKSMT